MMNTIDYDLPFFPDILRKESYLRELYSSLADTAKPWVEYHHYTQGWHYINLRYDYQNQISGLELPEYIVNAGFSILYPGCFINPHRGYDGYADQVYRCHFTLLSTGDTGICINGKNEQYTQGKLFAFDDTLIHYAWNDSNKPRVNFMFDVERKGKVYLTDKMRARHG